LTTYPKRIAIIGGGIAGVTAAWQLAQLDPTLAVTLFEASPRLGGIVETVREGGFVIECGPDGWVTEKPWARDLAIELGLESEIIPSLDATRKTWILLDGRLQAIPDGMRMMVPTDLEALDASTLFTAEAKQAFHNEILRADELRALAPHPTKDPDESVATFVLRHFGPEVLAKVGAPLLSGVFGGDVETLSVRAVMGPYVAMEREHGSLITALKLRTSNRREVSTNMQQATIFSTLKTGLGTLIDRMVAAIPPHWIQRNTEVKYLSHRPGEGWLIGTNQSTSHFDHVFLAAPPDVARALLQPIDAEAATLMAVEASSAICVALAFPSQVTLPQGFGLLVPPTPGTLLMAATFTDQKYPHRAPENKSLLRAFFGGAAAERLSRCNNDELAAIARHELARILGPLPEPQITVIRRWPRSLPQYAVGHLERMQQLTARITQLTGLTLLGNGYHGVGLPDLIRDSRFAAKTLVK